jgi:AFG3 family protein
MIDLAYSATKDLLLEHRDKLEILAQALLKREIIYQHDLVELIGERPFEKPTVYQEFLDKKEEVVDAEEAGSEPKTDEESTK